MAGVPPLIHDRALALQPGNTLPVTTRRGCPVLYISGNSWRHQETLPANTLWNSGKIVLTEDVHFCSTGKNDWHSSI